MDMFTRLRPFAFVLAAGAMLAGAVPAAAAPSAVHQSMAAPNTTASSYVADSEECAFLGMINSYRQINGLGSLALSKTLSAAADDHSLDMVRNNYFSHTLADGSSWPDNIAAHG